MKLIVIPCSWCKLWSHQIQNESFSLNEEDRFEDHIGDLRPSVLLGRKKYQNMLKDKSVPALDRYNGILYKTDSSLRARLSEAIRQAAVQVVILSGGYGAVTASQRIRWYNQPFEFDHWLQHKLPEALVRFAEGLKPDSITGLFKSPSEAPGTSRCSMQRAEAFLHVLNRMIAISSNSRVRS